MSSVSEDTTTIEDSPEIEFELSVPSLAGQADPGQPAASVEGRGQAGPNAPPFEERMNTFQSHGWHPMPLPPRSKAHPPAGFTGINVAPPTVEQVATWAMDSALQHHNIALRLPDSVIALDVDNYGEHDAPATMRAAVERFGPLPKVGRLTSRDDKVSGHRFFRVPTGTRLVSNLSQVGLGDGVDVLQHHHRYSIAPGSTHPSGLIYQWLDTQGAAAKLPSVADLPELPNAWLEGLRAPERATADMTANTEAFEALTPSIQSYVRDYVADEVGRLYAELDALADLPEGAAGPRGGWQDSCLAITQRLSALALANWSPLSVSEVERALAKHLPNGGGFTKATGMSMFDRAVDKGELAPLPRDIGAAILIDALGGMPTPEPTPSDLSTLWPKRDWTASGNVERTLDHLDGRLLFDAARGIWFAFDERSGLWSAGKPGSDDAAAAWVSRAMDAACEFEIGHYSDEPALDSKGNPKPASSQRDKFVREMRSGGASMHGSVAKMLRRRASDYGLLFTGQDFDVLPEHTVTMLDAAGHALLVNLLTGQTRPTQADDRITRRIPQVWNPDATAPQFEKFLRYAQPDPAQRRFVLFAFAASLVQGNPQRALYIHHGHETGSGKSVALNTVHHVMGADALGYGRTVKADFILRSRYRREANEHASVEISNASRHFLALTEAPDGSALDETKIKALTSEEWLSGRPLGGEPIDYQFQPKMHMTTNSIHGIGVKVDQATRDRLHLIEWAVPARHRDPALTRKLSAEAPGILALLARTYRELAKPDVEAGVVIRDAYSLPVVPSMVEARAEWLGEASPVQMWRDQCTADLPASAPVSEMTLNRTALAQFRGWAASNGYNYGTSRNDVRWLAGQLGVKTRKSNGKAYYPFKITVQSDEIWAPDESNAVIS